MTTIAPPNATPRAIEPDGASTGLRRLLGGVRSRAGIRAETAEGVWVLPAAAAVLVLTTLVYVVNLPSHRRAMPPRHQIPGSAAIPGSNAAC